MILASAVVVFGLALLSQDFRDWLGDKNEILQSFFVNLYQETRSKQ